MNLEKNKIYKVILPSKTGTVKFIGKESYGYVFENIEGFESLENQQHHKFVAEGEEKQFPLPEGVVYRTKFEEIPC